jgi:hypothetical protein
MSDSRITLSCENQSAIQDTARTIRDNNVSPEAAARAVNDMLGTHANSKELFTVRALIEELTDGNPPLTPNVKAVADRLKSIVEKRSNAFDRLHAEAYDRAGSCTPDYASVNIHR